MCFGLDDSNYQGKMNEDKEADIKQILDAIDTFVSLYENRKFPKEASTEDIKVAFKLGQFIEKSIENFKSKNALPQFLNLLKSWWKNKNRTKHYDEHFFELGCDHMLSNFFKYPNLSENNLEVAVRMYTSMFCKDRLSKCFANLILHQSSLQAIADISNDICTTHINDQKIYLILNHFIYLHETGKSNLLKEELNNYLSSYKVNYYLNDVIGMLSIDNSYNNTKEVQNIVLECVLEKMLDRSLLSENFWLTLIKTVDTKVLCNACRNFRPFLLSLLNFLIYIGSMMEKNSENIWCVDINIAHYKEISFNEIFVLLKNIFKINEEIGDFVFLKLKEAKQITDSPIWEDTIQLL